MNSPIRIATVVVALSLALAGCKSSKPAAVSASTTPAHATATSTATVAPRLGSTSPAASAPAGSKTCTTGHTSAVIGGVNKCLAPGQQCSSKHISDYPQYGYSCEQTGTRYILKKKM